MLDVGFLPQGFKGNLQIFTAPASVTNLQWQTWRKPRGYTHVYMLCVGGGGGGGGGFTRVAGNAGGAFGG